MAIEIRPITEDDIAGFHAALDEVARERVYLAATEAPPIESTAAFVRSNIEQGNPQFVAIDGTQLVGWCDIIRHVRAKPHAHRGTLGIGLINSYRRQGIGRQLMETTIAAARERGMTRIELTVRADNLRAVRVYERMGFEREGLQRNATLVDGQYHDICLMALLV